jgi:hypothetical protein
MEKYKNACCENWYGARLKEVVQLISAARNTYILRRQEKELANSDGNRGCPSSLFAEMMGVQTLCCSSSESREIIQ